MMEIIKMKKYCLKKGIPRAIRSTLRRCLTRITIGSKRHHNKNSARLVVGSPRDFGAEHVGRFPTARTNVFAMAAQCNSK